MQACCGDAGAAALEADEISLADVVSDATAPPPPAPSHPQLNPFTPEWFAQLVGAAASAAASAAAKAAVEGSKRAPAPQPDPAVPRRLNDRKVPDFWEDRPEFWFRIFDNHLSHFAPSEQRCFDDLLPLLTHTPWSQHTYCIVSCEFSRCLHLFI